MARTATAPDSLPFTADEEANRLLASDPAALLIGFVLDQQVTVQKAFSGPLELRTRLGHLERVRALCAFLEERYGGDAARIWREARSGDDLRARLAELPGFGEMKVRTVMTLLARQFGVRPPGIEALLPDHPTLGDVRTAEELAAYQAHKRATKAARRAAAAGQP